MKKIALVVACSASLVLPSVAFADEAVVAPQVQQTQDLSAVMVVDVLSECLEISLLMDLQKACNMVMAEFLE